MRRLKIILGFVLLVLSVNSCDFFRRIVNRPTSQYIETKRQLIESQNKAHNNRLDSIDIIQKQIADSLAILDSIRLHNSRLIEVKNLTQASKDSLSYRYYTIIATFSNPDNAQRYSKTIIEQGIAVHKVYYANGYIAIGVKPSNTLSDAYLSMIDVRANLSPEAWILDNKK